MISLSLHFSGRCKFSFQIKQITLLFFLLLLFTSIIDAKVFKTIQVKFRKELFKKNQKEIAKGTIYYETGKKIYLKVYHPVNQWMVIKDNNLIIYYPDEKKAFKIIAKVPFTLPFFQQFVAVVEEDYGLSKLRYKLIHNKVTNNILYAYWKPPEILSKQTGNFILGYKKNKLVYAETKNKINKQIVKVYYSNHIKYKNIFFPLKIKTVQYYKKKELFKEIIIYKKPVFDNPIPMEVQKFKIPENINIKEVRW